MQPRPDLDPITARLRAEEARARRRTLLLTLVPVAVALLLIFYTNHEVSQARNTLEAIKSEIDSLRTVKQNEIDSRAFAVDSLEAVLTELTRQVGEAQAQRAADEAASEIQQTRLTARFYLHILDESQRPAARQIERFLEEQQSEVRLTVPGIERVARGPDVSEIRYFRSEDATTARRIQALAERQGVSLRIRDLTERYRDATDIRPGHFEVWFGKDFPPAR